ncbi:MAG: hypothetical protein A4E71_01798 [Smithella sp. PtaU1.Bin162]|nr:MAG: hypothetical protein A4E71_01798 [Smithella sp. PtaU1.Bin162]
MADDQKDLRILKNRLEALVDGIFAFAMTLLVTGLVIPHLSKTEAKVKLAPILAGMQSEFISFIVAFFVLASFWRIHNRQYHYIRIIDSVVMRITLFTLIFVVLMPFTTNLSGDYSDVQLAVCLFHGNMFSLGFFLLIHWWYLAKTPEITSSPISRSTAFKGICRSMITPVISALAFIVSFISPSWSMAVYFLIIPFVVVVEKHSRPS